MNTSSLNGTVGIQHQLATPYTLKQKERKKKKQESDGDDKMIAS